MSLLVELRRRNVFRVAGAYLVVGWLLTEVLTAILPAAGAPEWTSNAVVLIFALGFIPAVILAWFYEITPEGIKRDHEVERDADTSKSRRLEYTTIAAVVLGVILLGIFSARPTGDGTIDPDIQAASVAVLPFVNMSNDEDNEYFSDGLTETLLHMLAQMPDLQVAARTSSFAFKNRNTNVSEIANALRVAHILEGSVQRSGDRVRITAQLIRAKDGFHMWSEVYDRTLDDIFGIQDEIASRVGAALSVSLLGTADDAIEGVGTEDTDAYDLYLQARREISTFSYGGLTAAEQLLKGALTIDPEFIDAKTELTSVYLNQSETGLLDAESAYQEIMAITEQVIDADPDNVLARANRLFAENMLRPLQGEAEPFLGMVDQFKSLLDEDPNEYQIRILVTRVLGALKRRDEALEIQLEGRRRDPFNPRIHYELGSLYSQMRRYDEAVFSLEESLRLEPRQPNTHAVLAHIRLDQGDGLGYLQHLLQAMEIDPQDHEMPGIIAQFLYELELVEEANDFRARVMAIAPTSEIAYRLELLHAIQTGDRVASAASARRAIVDDVADRRGGFVGAVQHLMHSAVLEDRVEAELAWLNTQAPGILDVDDRDAPSKYRNAQFVAFDALYTILPTEEMIRRLDALRDAALVFGVDPMLEPVVQFNVFAWTDQTESAVEVGLDRILSRSVLVNLGWERWARMPHVAAVVSDPRMVTALAGWQSEESEQRERIRTYLADLQAS